MIDIRFTNRWAGFSYMDLYQILDALNMLPYGPRNENGKLVSGLIHAINKEMIERQKRGAKHVESQLSCM